MDVSGTLFYMNFSEICDSVNPNLPTPFMRTFSVENMYLIAGSVWIMSSHMSLERGMSRLHSETNISAIIYYSHDMRLMAKIEYLIVSKGMKFIGLGQLGLKEWT